MAKNIEEYNGRLYIHKNRWRLPLGRSCFQSTHACCKKDEKSTMLKKGEILESEETEKEHVFPVPNNKILRA